MKFYLLIRLIQKKERNRMLIDILKEKVDPAIFKEAVTDMIKLCTKIEKDE